MPGGSFRRTELIPFYCQGLADMSVSRASFEFVRTVLRQRSAHSLEDDKLYLVETRLLPVAQRHGFQSVEDLVLRLRSRQNENLLCELVEAMTINETFFFRDGHPFEVLRQQVLPELVQRRAEVRCLNIWSAACSSGQEPYSVAILLRHYFPALSGWNVRLIASDLSAAMLTRARHGRYTGLEISRGLEPELLETYFHKRTDGWQIKDEVRRMVDFFPINLSGAWPELPMFDLVLLRNVLIYFDVPTRQRMLDRVRSVLQPDGYLLLGGAETTYNLDDRFIPVALGGVSFFQLRADASV
jgi:chemotaxis protein methyltransferase CheR